MKPVSIILLAVLISSPIITRSSYREQELHGQLTKCQQNSTNHSKLLKEDLANCEQYYTTQSNLLEDASKQLLTYKRQSQLIENVDNQVDQMEMCSMKLKEYCDLKSKAESKSLAEHERNKMNRYLKYLGCSKVISEHHYDRTIASYNTKLRSLLETKEMFIVLLIRGDFKEMEKVQAQQKDLPFTKCQFICDLEEVNANSDFYKRFTDATWNIYQRVFC